MVEKIIRVLYPTKVEGKLCQNLAEMSRGRGIAKLVCKGTIEVWSYSCTCILIILMLIFILR